MALIHCHECAARISDQARNCPHCGAPTAVPLTRQLPQQGRRPTPPAIGHGAQIAVLVVVVAMGLMLIADRMLPGGSWLDRRAGPPAASPAARQAAAARQRAACRADADCWGQRHVGQVIGPCQQSIRALAKYAIRWPSGLLTPPFARWTWRDQQRDSLAYIGHIELQNGFGAWQPYTAVCVYDTGAARIIDFHIQPGIR